MTEAWTAATCTGLTALSEVGLCLLAPTAPLPLPIFQVGEAEKELGGANATNPFAQLVDEAEGLDKIEDLQVRH